MSTDEDIRAAVRAEVRAYVNGIGLRYLPALATLAAFLLLIVLVPDGPRETSSTLGSAPSSQDGSTGTGGGATGQVLGGTDGASGGTVGSTSGGTGSGVTGPVAGTSGLAATTSGSATSGGPSSTGPGSIAINGTKCGRGIRQFAFAPYAPLCTPKFTGSNGGATSRGVDAKTITVVMRGTTDYDAYFKSIKQPGFAEQAADVRTFIAYFNTQFELYGRHVVLKTFNGNGSYIAEAGGQDQSGAAADAQTAYSLGAFAEIEPAFGSWNDALNSKHIITFTLQSDTAAFRANQPYRYGGATWPVLDSVGPSFGALTCQRLKGRVADYAGPAYSKSQRKYAVIEPEQAPYHGVASAYQKAISSCGLKAEVLEYNLGDVGSYATAAAQMVAKLKADNVTTVMYAGDQIYATVLLQAASNQQYVPEWFAVPENDSAGRQANQEEMAHFIALTPLRPNNGPASKRLCYQIFTRASRGAAPQSGAGLDGYCSTLLELFGALQTAGPQLSPAAFQAGWFRQPDSAGSSDFGSWNFAQGQFSPDATFLMNHWKTGASPSDGQAGYFDVCDKGRRYAYKNASFGTQTIACQK